MADEVLPDPRTENSGSNELFLRKALDSFCLQLPSAIMTDNHPPSAAAILNGNVQPPNTSDSTESTTAAEHDLLPKLIPHLDRHLIFPLLEFVSGQTPEDDAPDPALTRTKYELLKQTNMTDYVLSLWQDVHSSDDVPEEFRTKKEEVLNRLSILEGETAKLDELLSDESVTSNLRSDKVANLKYLETTHGVTSQMVDQLLEFGNFKYSCGSYDSAAHLLDQFRILSTDNDKISSATWGKLACDILTTNWDAVLEEITKVRESIDTKLFNNPLAQLQHRTWLIHWSLFPLFNHDPARDILTELFFSPNFINTIQTDCPWILRYLSATVVTNYIRPNTAAPAKGNQNRNTGNQQKQLKDLVRAVRQESYEYSDPITSFLRALYIDFDFSAAQHHLSTSHTVLKSDFFLSSSADAFVDASRHLISESYCKIHQRIDIADLSGRLGLSDEEGEKWIVNLIRETRMDGKLDAREGTVVMNHPGGSVYQQVIERTKGMFFRASVLRYVFLGTLFLRLCCFSSFSFEMTLTCGSRVVLLLRNRKHESVYGG